MCESTMRHDSGDAMVGSTANPNRHDGATNLPRLLGLRIVPVAPPALPCTEARAALHVNAGRVDASKQTLWRPVSAQKLGPQQLLYGLWIRPFDTYRLRKGVGNGSLAFHWERAGAVRKQP